MKKTLLIIAWAVVCCPTGSFAQFWETEILRTDIIGAWIRAADIDLDGDGDVVIQAGDSIYWHENTEPGWQPHLIDPNFYNSPYSWVDIRDFDGDGDPDVFKVPTTGPAPFSLTWNENINNGDSWVNHPILEANFFVGWMQDSYGDLDGDGDLDIALPEYQNETGQMSWLEYQDNTGEFLQHMIWSGDAISSTVADMDGDGDLDIIIGTTGIVWLENQLPDDTWTEHEVQSSGNGIVLVVDAVDLSGDGLPEIIADHLYGPTEKVAYYLNPSWQAFDVIVGPGILLGELGDVDNDGDTDITYGGSGFTGMAQALGWAENQGSSSAMTLHDITSPATSQVFCSGLADFDGDSDLDIVSLDFNVNSTAGDVFWAVNPLIDAEATTIRLHSITDGRQTGGDHGYTLNGPRMINHARPKLENPAYFSPTGIYPKTILINDSYGTEGSLESITSISGIDMFYFGVFNKLDGSMIPFTNAELDSLYAWSKRGGKMLIGASGTPSLNVFDPSNLNAHWGFDIVYHIPLVQVLPPPTGEGEPLFNGPFGMVAAANQGGASQGYFNELLNEAVVMGEEAEGNATLILDCATLDLIVADNDVHTDLGGMSLGASILNDNDRFWLNTIAFLDQLQGPPVITTDGNTLSTGDYLEYQWLLDGEPVSGANEAIFTPTETGYYSVWVSMSCGCPYTSEPVFVSVTGTDIALQSRVLKAFPNPAMDGITFDLNDEALVLQGIEIYDMLGKKIRTIEVQPNFPAYISLTGLSAGAYTARLLTNDGVFVSKIIKE